MPIVLPITSAVHIQNPSGRAADGLLADGSRRIACRIHVIARPCVFVFCSLPVAGEPVCSDS